MNTDLFIDGILRQTAKLVVRVATHAGERANVGHVADVMFSYMAEELEARGVGRKLAADMFGIRLRSYQKKVQRTAMSRTFRGKTLWQAVRALLLRRGRVARGELLGVLRRDDPVIIGAILNDLVRAGVVECRGRGDAAVYHVVDRRDAPADEDDSLLAFRVWSSVDRAPIGVDGLARRLHLKRAHIRALTDELVRSGSLRLDDDGKLRAQRYEIASTDPGGFEAAMIDHLTAVTENVVDRLEAKARGEERPGGGTTLAFVIHDSHPYRDETLALLETLRGRTDELWRVVADHNQREPHAKKQRRQKVRFYLGQSVHDLDDANEE